MATLIFERAFKLNLTTGEVESYWPENWPLDALVNELMSMGTPFFSAAYMNDPAALEGNKLLLKWLHTYTHEELIAARNEAGIRRGAVFAGIDPSAGGQGDDPDEMACVAVEVIRNRGYLIDFFSGRYPIEDQAQRIEDWLDMVQPDTTALEETSSRGFVYVGLTSQVNDNQGTKHSIVVRTPQGAKDKGGKTIRLLAMAARFETGQMRLPGIITNDGNIIIDPRWEHFTQEWRAYPTDHDDILDACYWAAHEAFTDVIAAGTAKQGPPRTTDDKQRAFIEEATKDDLRADVPIRDRRGKTPRRIGSTRDRLTHNAGYWN